MATLAPDRARARATIADILDALPADATLVDAKRALRGRGPEVSPGNGLRWAYQCWQREKNEALRKRFRLTKEHEPRFTVNWNPSNPASVRWWIGVFCPYCRLQGNRSGGPKGGCIGCAPMRDRLSPVVDLPEWRAFRKALCEHPEDAPIVADWLEEHGLEEVAATMRSLPKEATKP